MFSIQGNLTQINSSPTSHKQMVILSYVHLQVNHFYFCYGIIQTSCFFFGKKWLNSLSKVADMFHQPSVLTETPDSGIVFYIRQGQWLIATAQ